MRHVLIAMLLAALALPSAVLCQSATEQEVTRFVEQFKRHWEAADAEALARMWRGDGDWMSITGSRGIRRGREQIAEVWSIGLQGRDTKQSRQVTVEVDAVRLLGDDVAQVDMVLEFGHESTGLMREAMVALLERDETGWSIVSCRVARITP